MAPFYLKEKRKEERTSDECYPAGKDEGKRKEERERYSSGKENLLSRLKGRGKSVR